MFNNKKYKKMKNQALAITKVTSNPELDDLLDKQHPVIKDLARKNAEFMPEKINPHRQVINLIPTLEIFEQHMNNWLLDHIRFFRQEHTCRKGN